MEKRRGRRARRSARRKRPRHRVRFRRHRRREDLDRDGHDAAGREHGATSPPAARGDDPRRQGRERDPLGERLEFAAEIGPGDFVYFAPYVPHQERNLSDRETVDFVVVRSGNEGFVTKLDATPVEQPETVF